MADPFINERLEYIRDSIGVLETYMLKIQSIDDFATMSGSLVYDALLMRLQVIGENLKALMKMQSSLFISMKFEISYIVSFRDISQVYEKLEPEIVYDICTQYIPALKTKVEALLKTELS